MSILRQAKEAIASARHATDEPSGKVSFGLPHGASNALALALLQEVRQQFPAIQLELTQELTANLSQQLISGQINLAILFDDGDLSDFEFTPLLRERMYLIEPAQDTVSQAETTILQQVLSLALILPASPHGVRPILARAASQTVARLTRQLVSKLCADQDWLSASTLPDGGDPG